MAQALKKYSKELKRARLNQGEKSSQELFFLTEPSLFDEAEGTFINYHTRKRVKVYLVPAPWSRVILVSLIYAVAISLSKASYFGVKAKIFGDPVVQDLADASDNAEQ